MRGGSFAYILFFAGGLEVVGCEDAVEFGAGMDAAGDDVALGVEEDHEGYGVEAVEGAGLDLRVGEDGPRDFELLYGLAGFVVFVADGDAEDFEVGVILGEVFEVRHGLAAGFAPRGPEVDEREGALADEVGELGGVAVDVFEAGVFEGATRLEFEGGGDGVEEVAFEEVDVFKVVGDLRDHGFDLLDVEHGPCLHEEEGADEIGGVLGPVRVVEFGEGVVVDLRHHHLDEGCDFRHPVGEAFVEWCAGGEFGGGVEGDFAFFEDDVPAEVGVLVGTARMDDGEGYGVGDKAFDGELTVFDGDGADGYRRGGHVDGIEVDGVGLHGGGEGAGDGEFVGAAGGDGGGGEDGEKDFSGYFHFMCFLENG